MGSWGVVFENNDDDDDDDDGDEIERRTHRCGVVWCIGGSWFDSGGELTYELD